MTIVDINTAKLAQTQWLRRTVRNPDQSPLSNIAAVRAEFHGK
jgi:hypothetical protein